MGQNLTIADIARLSGVSKATVSRVLSNSSLVKEATKKRVQDIIDKYHYEPNELARALSTKRSSIIGVVIDELANPFFIEVAKYVEDILYDNKYLMLLCSSGWDSEKEYAVTKALINRSVDGILLASTSNKSKTIDLLARYSTPFVLFNLYDDDDDYSYVCVNDYQGGRIAGEYFQKLKVDKYIILLGFEHFSLSQRKQGFTDVISEMSDKTPMVCYDKIETYQDGYDIAKILIEENNLVNEKAAIFILNDNVAIGMIDGMMKEGISIPKQVAVLGFDDIKMASRYVIGLSSIAQPIKEMSMAATNELLRLIHEPDSKPRKMLFEPRLIIRESSNI